MLRLLRPMPGQGVFTTELLQVSHWERRRLAGPDSPFAALGGIVLARPELEIRSASREVG
jgi:hypothetical protein